MESKSIFQSVTFYGAVVSLLNFVLPHMGVKFDDASTEMVAQGIVAIIGAAVTIYGRLKANKTAVLKQTTVA